MLPAFAAAYAVRSPPDKTWEGKVRQRQGGVLRPGDQVEFLEHNGRITILKKTRGASAGVLRHRKADTRFSDEASLREALASRRAKVTAKRRAA